MPFSGRRAIRVYKNVYNRQKIYFFRNLALIVTLTLSRA